MAKRKVEEKEETRIVKQPKPIPGIISATVVRAYLLLMARRWQYADSGSIRPCTAIRYSVVVSHTDDWLRETENRVEILVEQRVVPVVVVCVVLELVQWPGWRWRRAYTVCRCNAYGSRSRRSNCGWRG